MCSTVAFGFLYKRRPSVVLRVCQLVYRINRSSLALQRNRRLYKCVRRNCRAQCIKSCRTHRWEKLPNFGAAVPVKNCLFGGVPNSSPRVRVRRYGDAVVSDLYLKHYQQGRTVYNSRYSTKIVPTFGLPSRSIHYSRNISGMHASMLRAALATV